MRTYKGACQWFRRKAIPPWSLQKGGTVVAGRAARAAFLRQEWAPIFGHDIQYTSKPDGFINEYKQWIPDFPEISLPPLSSTELRGTIQKMVHKSTGLDGRSAKAILSLPEEAFQQLVSLLERIEAGAGWPPSLCQRKLVFLPKEQTASPKPTDVLKTRPIAAGSLLYRAWGKCRFRQLGPSLVHALPLRQAGGLPGEGAKSLLMSWQNEGDEQLLNFGASLDFQKAFDSTDSQMDAAAS